ncbi:MAG: hypothetical protein DRJ60_02100 [Thermoprotei archaeon]|nr:MAG: hypothetical protein DRJ60_02100 [Thermoprotei archaeon]
MMPLLMMVLEAAFVIAVVLLILLAIYGFSIKVTKSLSRESLEKRKPFACGESIPPSKTSLPDMSMYAIVWRRVFQSLYTTLRDKLHTGILSDWLVWMFIFMVVIVIVLVVV